MKFKFNNSINFISQSTCKLVRLVLNRETAKKDSPLEKMFYVESF